MKRCPQCEFIYEDDQSLCDMDGVLLVFDSRKLPNLHALATVPPVPRAQRRNRAVPAFATLVLALVLGMVYFVSTRQPSYAPASQPEELTIAPVAIPTPEPQLSPEPAVLKEEVKESAAPVKKPATKSTTVSQTKRATEPKKEDSKVNSILKKTGRILKKPFKKF
jgi:hypothetical protein